MRDMYSNFAFLEAFPPQDLTVGNLAGDTIDLRGYNGCTFVIVAAGFTGGGDMSAGDHHQVAIELGYASAAGVSCWSAIPYGSMVITSLFSEAQTLTSGNVLSVDSASWSGVAVAFGVKQLIDSNHRYIRLNVSGVGDASICSMAAICILGYPANWPVMEPMR